MKKLGLNKVNHHPPISEEHLRQLYSGGVFDTKNTYWSPKKGFFLSLCYISAEGKGRREPSTVENIRVRVWKDTRWKKIRLQNKQTKCLRTIEKTMKITKDQLW